jgi:(p)ppGpp synthase/HD superfamily hydrolase
VLRNGQTVQIITAKGATPNPAWVNFVVSAKARTSIRHYLKGLRHGEAVDLGRRLLTQALGEFHLKPEAIDPGAMSAALAEFGLKETDELYEKIGLGERLAPLVARRLLPGDAAPDTTATPTPLTVAGTEGLLVTYAHCCYPIPGDAIIAFLSSGRGIVIHRDGCANVEDYHKHPDKWLPVNWQQTAGRHFQSEIRIHVTNRMGVLAALSAALASTQTNISQVQVEQRDEQSSVISFVLDVRDREHLASVIRVVRRMDDVERVVRTIATHNRRREPNTP